MNPQIPLLVSGVVLCLAASTLAQTPAPTPAPLPPPPQNLGLPYTQSAFREPLASIRDGIAVRPGSRYGYVRGARVRLDETDLLRGAAVAKGEDVFVPASFAALVLGPTVTPPAVPSDLASIADRWVYRPSELTKTSAPFAAPAGVATLEVRGQTWFSFADLARQAGLTLRTTPDGVHFAGPAGADFPPKAEAARQSLVTLFDTPDKLADPSIAAASIPLLTRQEEWTKHVKVTPAQLEILNGPETEWPTVPASSYDLTGFDAKRLGSKVPPPGVYPRLLFSPDDVPALAARVKGSLIGQKSLIEMKHLFAKTWWDPKTDDGRLFVKLASGDLAGLEWDAPAGTPLNGIPHQFKGYKFGIHNSHVAYVPECLTTMAVYALLTDDDALGRKVATALANYFLLREPLLDQWLTLSDSQFGSSYVDEAGNIVAMNGNGARTHWRNIHGVVAHMNLAFALDFAGRWMTPAQIDTMRRVISKATYGRRSYAQDAPVRFRDVNWCTWDLPHFLAVASIEGLPGFDAEAFASGAETVRAFCDWGIDDKGVVFESNGKTPGSFQFHLLSMVTLARRGENLFGHPHWRRLLEGQVQMTSPTGLVTINSGTQYAPYSRQPLSLNLINEIKGFFPQSRLADYLITKAISQPGAEKDEYLRSWPQPGFDPAAYEKSVAARTRLRLPSPTYPGFVNAVLFDGDIVPTTRADLDLPLDFNSPVSGLFSSYSDRTPEAVWMNLYVRPNHYLGAGHHHADAGMFHFSALGVDWFTESPFSQSFDGKYTNLVLVDGESLPTSLPECKILGYNAAATYLGATLAPQATVASADLTYAYSWRWLTQPPQEWSPALVALGWEMEPSPRIAQIFAGTAHSKLRPWWPTYTFGNYIATSRAPFNPMKSVFRSAGLVRGGHAYGFVIDDLKKDDRSRLYQWAGMLNGGVWQADVPGLAPNQCALAYRAGDPPLGEAAAPAPIKVQPGDPLLLVCALGMERSGEDGLPLLQVERRAGPPDKKNQPQYFNRLVINQRAPEVAYRVLLLPVRAGEPLPTVSYDAKAAVAIVRWGKQTDEFRFAKGEDARTRVTIRRDGRDLAVTPTP